MPTLNATSTTNNANQVLWTYQTRMVWHTDRAVTGAARGAEVQALENLGVSPPVGDPFTNLT